MNKIDFPRTGVDGTVYTKEDIERGFTKVIEVRILKRLNKAIGRWTLKESIIIEFIKRHLHDILVADPDTLGRIAIITDVRYKDVFSTNNGKNEVQTVFGKEILDCFNYAGYRKKKLVEHSKRLNVKTCPYCNQHYTLYIDKSKGNASLALFQFDHFFDKMRYPFLSMSMYNLIPSCPTCNHNKSTSTLPLKFNPYYQDIADLFKFHFDSTVNMELWGGRISDPISLSLIPAGGVTQAELDEFNSSTHLTEQYMRHKDVIEEAYSRAYIKDEYIEWNYPFLTSNDELRNRVIHGTYMDNADISKRPLSKFYQDIYEEALK